MQSDFTRRISIKIDQPILSLTLTSILKNEKHCSLKIGPNFVGLSVINGNVYIKRNLFKTV